MLALALNTKLGKHGLTIGTDWLSGSEASDTENRSFSPLFGTNHKFYGLMDYFYVGNGHGNIGLGDFFLKTNWKVGPKSNVLVHLHQFVSPVEVLDSDGTAMSSSLAQEMDLVFNHNFGAGMNFKVGFSVLEGSDTLGNFKSGDPSTLNYWGWTMVTFKPNFLTAE